MRWFYNLKMAGKLMLVFLILAVLTGLVGLAGVRTVAYLDERDTMLYEKGTIPIADLMHITDAFQRTRVNVLQLVYATAPEERRELMERIKERRAEIDKYSADYEKRIMNKDMKEVFQNYLDLRRKYGSEVDKIVELTNSGRQAEALALINGESERVRLQYQDVIQKMTTMKLDDANDLSDTNSAEAARSIKIMTTLMVVSVILAILLGWLMARFISKQLQAMVAAGKLLAKGDTSLQVEVKSTDELGSLTATMQEVIGSMRDWAQAVERVAAGDTTVQVEVKSENDILSKNINKMVGNIRAIISETDSLANTVMQGQLNQRGHAENFQGAWSDLVKGLNQLIEAFVNPIHVTADYVDRISKGDLPPKITETYHGDFNEIKNNLNRCIDTVNALIDESLMLSQAAVEGQLNTRGNADKFSGSYRQIVKGVNDTLDAVLQPVNEAAACLEQMANGNLAVQVKGDYKGDHAMIKNALNTTIDAMNEILHQVASAVDQISAGAHEIAASSQALSQGATESASAVEETTSSMHQMGAQTNQNAENSIQANQLAVLARDNAEKGNQLMEQMVKAMGDINESGNNISRIIKVIDEIAFQTNLLALNAAVEAARAGKHGKGFTVVAEEVRNLAQRSAKAAKETTEMIENSIKKTGVGTKIAEETAESLSEIVQGATRVTDLISEIAAASKEQAQGIHQINVALGQVDQVTQQNTASSEELASASEEMSGQAAQLKGMLRKFTLKKRSYVQMMNQQQDVDDDMIEQLEQEAKRQQRKQSIPWGGKVNRPTVNPESVISLDDKDFGKF